MDPAVFFAVLRVLADNTTDLIDLINGRGGVIALTLVILFAGAKRWWVYGGFYRDVDAERVMYRDLYLQSLKLTDEAVHTAEAVVKAAKKRVKG